MNVFIYRSALLIPKEQRIQLLRILLRQWKRLPLEFVDANKSMIFISIRINAMKLRIVLRGLLLIVEPLPGINAAIVRVIAKNALSNRLNAQNVQIVVKNYKKHLV